ncbi:hypothetical protein BH24DEI2_BH24DEI2_22120 [soil metagenome]
MDVGGYLFSVQDPTLWTWVALVNSILGVFFALPMLWNPKLGGLQKLAWLVFGFALPPVAFVSYWLTARRTR